MYRKLPEPEYIKTSVPADKILTWYEYWNKNKESIKKVSEDEKLMLSTPESKNLAHKICIWEGDILKLEIDGIVYIVNNTSLLPGSDGEGHVIFQAAGPNLKKECRSLRTSDWPSSVVYKTSGHNLPAKYVLHARAPSYLDSKLLGLCYENSLKLAMMNDVRIIAFPCIHRDVSMNSSDFQAAVKVGLTTVRDFLLKNPNTYDRVIFCIVYKTDTDIFEELMQLYFGP